MIHFVVNHEPIGQPRHRVTTRGKFARMYLPSQHPIHGFKAAVRLAFGKNKLTDGGIEIVVNAWFPRPINKIWKRKQMLYYWHTAKPDCDNVLKAVLDSLNGLAWADDAQISCATVRKMVCGGDSEPRVEITIRTIAEAFDATNND